MGLYLRKSVSVGPFRFNLSGAGVGVSVGVKGFRVGSGPRGNYVRIGGNAIHYSATVPAATKPGHRSSSAVPPLPGPQIEPETPDRTHGPMVEIDSAATCMIVDSSSKALLDELNAKRRRWRRWPAVCGICGFMLFFLLMSGVFDWRLIVLLALSVVAVGAAHAWDKVQKSTVLMYDFDPEIERVLVHLHAAADILMSSAATWHVPSRAQVYDSKYHAGAQALISRNVSRFFRAPPPYVETNIQTIAVNVGAQTLHFFPDRVLVYDSGGVGAVSYSELQVDSGSISFVEEEVVPRDASVVGSTWRYVNKKGGPDRRFKDNREIPICRYDSLAFRSSTGLNEMLHVSRSGAGAAFADALECLKRAIPPERRI